jgi:hypothetical protein
MIAVIAAGALVGAQPRAPKIRTLTEQEMVDMMVGSSIQASRSSDSAGMIARVKEAIAQGRTFTLIDVEDLPANWTVAIPGAVGGGGAWEYVRERTARQHLPTVADGVLKAVAALSKYTGKKFDAVVRVEAASATLSAFMTASALGVPVVDACLSGRARPEVPQSIPFINGMLATPAAMVTRWGDTIIIDKAIDDYRYEDLARAVAVASGGGVSTASRGLSTDEMRRGVIRGAVSQAILFGRTVREARERGDDPVAALVKTSGGYKLFRGTVTKAEMKGERGFTWWDVELAGTHEFQGHVYKVFVKNENIVSWLDGKPDAMSPDFISNLDPKTGDTVFGQGLGAYPMNADVTMVGIPASPLWRTPKGIEVFGPRYFGFDFDYVPLEVLHK